MYSVVLLPLFYLIIAAQFNFAWANEDFFNKIEINLDSKQENFSHQEYRAYIQQRVKFGMQTPDQKFRFERNQAGIDRFQTIFFIDTKKLFSNAVHAKLSTKLESDWIHWNNGNIQSNDIRTKLLIKDAYIDALFKNNFWLRAGNQIFAWGESESLAITDVISPRDLREFGLSNLDDIREQVPALFLSSPYKNVQASLVLTYKAPTHRYAKIDESFYPFISYKRDGINVVTKENDQKWELITKLNYSANGVDLNIIAGEVNSNEYYPEILILNGTALIFSQPRIRVLGLSANKATENALLKGELAKHWGNRLPVKDAIFWQDSQQWLFMLGTEYSGWNNWEMALEFNGILTEDYTSSLAADRIQLGYYLRLQYKSLNERLTNQWIINSLTGNSGQIFRWDTRFELTDNLVLESNLIFYYANNETSLYPYRKNDSINLKLTFSF